MLLKDGPEGVKLKPGFAFLGGAVKMGFHALDLGITGIGILQNL